MSLSKSALNGGGGRSLHHFFKLSDLTETKQDAKLIALNIRSLINVSTTYLLHAHGRISH